MSLSSLFKSFPEHYQVLAENSKPVRWSQRSSAIASAARSHRVGFHVCSCECPSSSLQVHCSLRNVFLPEIPITFRCSGIEVHGTNPHDLFRGDISEGRPLSKGNLGWL